ncbi:hypothetical protein [Streptomyces hygroscopicus]|uniref:hypothetical protein n=1 Tax=Streptomyces hygroscopicus TaxID=1912 RepID=UPI00207B9FB4|nr:hypothetical protein [Streptomyces hygroscopicus]
MCGICPSLRLPGGAFDVHLRPSAACPFDASTGHRFTEAGVPVCVHPERVGLPAAEYATAGLPLPWETPPPASPDEVAVWVRAALDAAPPDACAEVIERATEILRAADPELDVVAVLRTALS